MFHCGDCVGESVGWWQAVRERNAYRAADDKNRQHKILLLWQIEAEDKICFRLSYCFYAQWWQRHTEKGLYNVISARKMVNKYITYMHKHIVISIRCAYSGRSVRMFSNLCVCVCACKWVLRIRAHCTVHKGIYKTTGEIDSNVPH